MATKTKRQPHRALPPIPGDAAVRAGALRLLMELAMSKEEARQFHLWGDATFGDETLDSAPEAFARFVAQGMDWPSIIAALGIDWPTLVTGLMDLAQGARVDWQPRKAVA